MSAKAIFIDWLTLSGRVNIDIDFYKVVNYKVEKRDYGTKSFKQVYVISTLCGKTELCTIVKTPCSSVLHPESAQIKFANSLLYQTDYLERIDKIIADFSFKFRTINRLDIACDFTDFENGQPVVRMIQDYLNGHITKVGMAKVACYFNNGLKRIYTGFTFGADRSPIQYKLYNKPAEMRAKAVKPHILKAWVENGLLKNVDDWEASEIWRLEFRIKGRPSELLEISGIIKDFSDLSNLFPNTIKGIYQGLCDKYFVFKDNNGAINTRKKAVKRHFFMFVTNSPITILLKDMITDVTRAKRIFIKHLYGVINNGVDFAEEQLKQLEQTFLDEINKYYLTGWAKKKGFIYTKYGCNYMI
jgi:hypothetical protein